MKIINEKGKLFGIINLIDLLIILAAALIIVFGYMFLNSSVNEPVEQKKQLVTVEITRRRESFCQNIKAGDVAIEVVNNVPIGVVKGVSYEPSVEHFVSDKDGSIKKITVPERFDAKVIVEVSADEEIEVGKLLSLRTKSFVGSGYVLSVEETTGEN